MNEIILLILEILIYPFAYLIMLTSEIILSAFSGFNRKINLSPEKMLKDANVDQDDGPAMSIDYAIPLVMLFRFPCILGSAFWALIFILYFLLR